MAISDGLFAHWSLDEAGGIRLDSHTSGYNFSDYNTVGSGIGKHGNAAQFTRANSEYLGIASSPDFNLYQQDFTVACWVYPTSSDTNQGVWFFNGSGGYHLRWTGSAFIFNLTGTVSSGTLALNNWYFVVCRYDYTGTTSFNMHLRVNTTDYAASRTGWFYNSNHGFEIGRYTTFYYSNHLIDGATIWKRFLSNEELDYVFNDGDGRDYASLISPPGSSVPAPRQRITTTLKSRLSIGSF